MTLKHILERVFDESAPKLLDTGDEAFIAEVILIFRQVRRVARILEFDTWITASRLPRPYEIIGTIILYYSDRVARDDIIGRIDNYRFSTSIGDKNLTDSRKKYIQDFSARRFASVLRESIEN